MTGTDTTGWSDIRLRMEPEPLVGYRTGMVAYEES